MTRADFYRYAADCDAVLQGAGFPLEVLAVPELHPLNAHPVNLARYESFATAPPTTAGLGAPLRESALYLARETWRAGLTADHGWLRDLVRRLDRNAVDVLIISSLARPEHLDTPEDFYFGSLQRALAERGLSSLRCLRNQTGERIAPLAALRERSTEMTVVLPNVTGAGSEARRLAGALAAATGGRDHALTEGSRRLFGAIKARCVSPAALGALRLHAQIGGLCAALSPRMVIAIFEGHAWERCVWRAAREARPGSPPLCVGYQHAVVWEDSYAIRRPLGKDAGCDPDVVLTVGHVTRAMLGRGDGAGAWSDVLAYGTHRRPKAEPAAAWSERPARSFVVLPEGILSECVRLLELTAECARRMPDARFIVRFHPITSLEQVRARLPAVFDLPNIEISRQAALAEDLARSTGAIYRGSSTVFYAVLAGLKPFYVGGAGEMNIDPLFPLDDWRVVVRSADDLVAYCADHPQGWSLAGAEWPRARDFCSEYVSPVDPHVIDALVDRLPGRGPQ